MGTRGYFCFKYKGKYFLFFKNGDAYPEGLGKDIVKHLNEKNIGLWKNLLELFFTGKFSAINFRTLLLECAEDVVTAVNKYLSTYSFEYTNAELLTTEILASEEKFENWCKQPAERHSYSKVIYILKSKT